MFLNVMRENDLNSAIAYDEWRKGNKDYPSLGTIKKRLNMTYAELNKLAKALKQAFGLKTNSDGTLKLYKNGNDRFTWNKRAGYVLQNINIAMQHALNYNQEDDNYFSR